MTTGEGAAHKLTIKDPDPALRDKKTLTQVIPFAVYEVITNHPLLREVEYESFEEVGK